jgi:tRNA uridine 5-carboxymethylaminomethyl modification enzyme
MPLRAGAVDWDSPAAEGIARAENGARIAQFLQRPGMTLERLFALLPEIAPEDASPRMLALLETEVKYAGYLALARRRMEQNRSQESAPIPPDMDYAAVPSMRMEARQALARFRPATLGAAARLAGVNPSDVAALAIALRRK